MIVKSMLVRIGADDTQMRTALKGAAAGLKKHSASFKKAGMAMTAAGGAITGAIGLMVKGYIKAGDEVHKMSLRTGLSTEALSELKYAAELSGTSLATVEKGVKKMASSIGEAKLGLKTYTDAFALIGMEVEELDGLNPEEQFMRMAKGIAEIEDPTQRAYAAQKLLGRAGTELLPLFVAGAKGMDAMRQEARNLGLSISELEAKKAADLNDRLTKMKGAFKGVTMSIASKLVPVITSVVTKISDIAQKVKDWMEAHPGLSKVILIVVAAIGGLLLVLGPLVMILPALAAGFALLMGPIGIVIGIVVALAAAAMLIIKNWAKIKGFFIGLWTKIKEIFFGVVEFIFEKVIWLMEKLSKIPIIKKFVKNIQGGLEDAKASLAEARENMKLSTEAMATGSTEAGETIKTSLEEVGTATETMATKVSSSYKTLVDEIKKATLSEYEYAKLTLEQKKLDRDAAIEKELLDQTAKQEALNLNEEAYQLAMTELETTAAEERKEKRDEQFAAYQESKQALVDSINQMTLSELEYSDWALDQEFERQKKHIEDTIKNEEERNELLKLLREKHLLDKKKAEEDHADEMTQLQINTMGALTSLYGDFIGDTLTAFEDWGAGTQGLLKGIGTAFGNLAKAAIQALKDIVVQEAISAAKTWIKEKAKAIAGVIASVMKSVPFPFNLIAVGGAIAAVTLLFSKIKLFKEGGFVPKQTLAMLHPGEFVVNAPTVRALSQPGVGRGGGIVISQKNYFYGDISNVGDLDEISKRLAQKTRRAIERGRK